MWCRIMLAVFLSLSYSKSKAEVIAMVVRSSTVEEGGNLRLINTGSEDVSFSGVLVEHRPMLSGKVAQYPDYGEHLALGPGRSIPANGMTEAIALPRLKLTDFTGRMDVYLQVGERRIKVERVVLEQSR